MKHLLFTLFSLFSLTAFNQTDVLFKLNNGIPAVASGDLSNIKVPVRFIFPATEFNGKQVSIQQSNGQTIAGTSFTFGQGELTADGEGGPYIYKIEATKKTNPGKKLISDEKIKLLVDGAAFSVQFGTGGGGTPVVVTPETPKPDPGTTPPVTDPYTPGYAYYDAMKISGLDKTRPADREVIKSILSYYGIHDKATLTANPFFKDLLGVTFFDDKNGPQGGEGLSAMLTNLGNTDVTSLASGLARFLAERTKEELNAAFFEKMKDQLNAYPELKTLFPKTSSFMSLIDNYSYASVIQVLKEAFQTDIQNLPSNLYDLKDLSEASCSGDKKAECEKRMKALDDFFNSRTGLWVSVGMRTLKETATASNPAELLNAVATSPDLAAIHAWATTGTGNYGDYNSASAIELANFLSANLLSNEEGKVWINTYELQKLTSKQTAIKAYLGILYARPESSAIRFRINGQENKNFQAMLYQVYEKYSTYSSQIIALIKTTHNTCNMANHAVERISTATEKSTEADVQSLYTYYQTFINTAKPIIESELLKSLTGYADLNAKFDSIERYLTPAIDMAYHLSSKQYSSAIYDAISLLNHPEIKAFDAKTTKAFIRYGTLISSVAGAQSSDEVKTALEASMLPSGSSSIKRNTRYSIALNAYVGGYYGNAYSHTTDSLHTATSYKTYGLYAPVGVSFNMGLKKAGGVSIIVQVIDVGALVNFYMLNDDETALPDDFNVRLSNIFAPGAQFAWNIPKTPLALTFGGQFVPALYQTSQVSDGSELTSSSAWRVNFSLVVDIPLLNVGAWDYKK